MPSAEYKIMSRQQEEILSLKARIAELERCVVMGGDGKPIGLRKIKYMYDPIEGKVVEFVVVGIKYIPKHGTLGDHTLIYSHNLGPMCTSEDCYSSPDSVPEGDKE